MQYILVFLEGIITFISPCLLPMLPIYLSYFAANEADRKKTLINAFGFVLGFTLVFVAMGAFAGVIGRVIGTYTTAFNLATGAIVIILGLNFLGVVKIGFLNRAGRQQAGSNRLGFFSAVLLGLVFSISWTPCVGAFLGSALLLASLQGSVLQGIAMLLIFSLGLGIPFVAAALLLDRLKSTFDWIKRNYRLINYFSGSLLVIIGILMVTGYMGYFLALLSF